MIRTDLIAPLAELLARQAAAFPDKIAFEDADRGLSYAGLATEVAALASQFVARGLKPGDTIGIWLLNSVDWVVATLAAIRAGGIAVPIAFDAKTDEMAYRVRDADISIMIARAEKRAALESAVRIETVILSDQDLAGTGGQPELAALCAEPDAGATLAPTTSTRYR